MKYKMGSLRYLGIKTTQVQALFCNPQTVVSFGFRRCSCCGEIKPFYGFGIYRSKMGKRNIRTYCKRCSMNMRNEWAAKNRDKTKAYMEKYKPNILRKDKEARLAKSCNLLNKGGYACFVVGDIRDKKGFYRDFISHTKQAFINAGAGLYNEAILLQPLGTAMLRAGKIFEAGGKLTKVHENVLIFKKP